MKPCRRIRDQNLRCQKEVEIIVDNSFPAQNAQKVFQMNFTKLLRKICSRKYKKSKSFLLCPGEHYAN